MTGLGSQHLLEAEPGSQDLRAQLHGKEPCISCAVVVFQLR